MSALPLLVFLACSSPAQDVAGTRGGEPPRLVVTICVDQLVPDQLERLGPWWSGGFRRFRESGWCLRAAAFEHGVTETGPGHATLATGLHPRGHGIVANEWVEADARGVLYCFDDPAAAAVTSAGVIRTGVHAGRGRSPARLRAPGLGDFLRAAHPKARIVSLSSKDRSAIGQVGRTADLALWWDVRGGSGFMSSTWYADDLPDWVDGWNAGWVERLLAGPFGAGWQHGLPEDEDFASSRTEPDDSPGESSRGRTFPHALPPLSEPPGPDERAALARWVYEGPAADQQVIELARLAVARLDLGADEHTDLLALGLSACDVVGHQYGPRSVEVTDTLLRADRLLGALFAELDERVGPGRWLAVLTADHGVLELPESLVRADLPAVRVRAEDLRAAFEAVRADLEQAFGSDFGLRPTHRDARLDAAALAAAGLDPASVRARAAARLLSAGEGFLAYVFPWEALRDRAALGPGPREFPAGAEPEAEQILRLEANSFDAERTPDLVLVPRPYHLLSGATGTGHGSPWPYDREVPLYFLGPGFPAGSDGRRAGPVDVLPTLLDRLGLEVPAGLDGRVLDPREDGER